MITKYGRDINEENYELYIDSVKNKVYKLLPLREEGLQWEKHLGTILVELSGFNSLTLNETKMITALSKLEALYELEEFKVYRKTVFECLNTLEEIKRG